MVEIEEEHDRRERHRISSALTLTDVGIEKLKMKEYPSIMRTPRYGVPVYIFDKPDGSNIRAEWSRKNGFWKFGRRNSLLDDSNPQIVKSKDLFLQTYGESLGKIFTDQRWTKAVAFFEFWGPQSFAGVHVDSDEHRVTLFDVSYEKKGLMEPRMFLKLFDALPIAPFLHHGTFNVTIEQQIRSGQLPGITAEGVVCKGSYVSPGLPLMFKVKTDAWVERVKSLYKGKEKLLEQLL